jgi:serine/threonine protein phosphatase PrpC
MVFSEGIYIICDGHGANGKQISEFISQTTYSKIDGI